MANIVGSNIPQLDIGQGGGTFLTGTGAFTPPTGKVVVAIQVHTQAAFTTLTASNDTGSNTYHIAKTVVNGAAGNGSGASDLGTNALAVGTWIYGRWSAVTLSGGKVFLYFAE